MPAGNFIQGDRNVPTHGYYQQRRHVALPAWAQNAEYFDRDAPFAVGTSGVNVGASGYTMAAPAGASTSVESPPGTLTLNCDGTNPAFADKQITVAPGMPYRITATVSGVTAAGVVGTTQGAADVLTAQAFSVGTNFFDFVAPAGGVIWVRFRRTAAGTAVVSAIRVEAL
jgi:hypothetical protein